MDPARLDWNDLRLLLAIARGGTLTAAAARLHLSQPTAGRRLRALEEACGCALFQRSAAGFRLTAEGEAVQRHAERMEAEALALERRLAGQGAGLEGLLRLSASDWVARLVLTPRLAGFLAAHPAIEIELVADSRLLDLSRREADLVFRFPRFDSPEIRQRLFAHLPYDLYASADYLERHGPAGDGSGHRLIGMNAALDGLPDAAWARQRLPAATAVFRSNSREVQAEACRHGTGLAVLPRAVGERFGLVRLEPAPGRDVWLGYHADLRKLPRLRALVDYLVEKAGEPAGSPGTPQK